MPHLPRLLAPLCAAAAMAAAAPAAHAASTATFPVGGPVATTVSITDAGPSADSVHLTVTAANPADLVNTKVFLGGDTTTPYHAVGVDGVRNARYGAGDDVEGDLSTAACSVYNGSEVEAPVTVAGDGTSYSADLPKGEVISFESTGVAVGIVGQDTGCTNYGFAGLDVDYANTHETIDGFSWADPPTPIVTQAVGGRRQVSLTFAQRPGTQYDIFRAGESQPFRGNLRGNGDAVQVDITESDDGEQLEPGTQYAFQVRATRLFHIWAGSDTVQPTSPLSAVATVTTAAAQTLQFTAAPATGTTARDAAFSWTMTGNPAGEAPWCVLDMTTEIACTATGASVTGVPVGEHTLSVFTADGENAYRHTWTVAAPAAAPAPITLAPPALKPAAPAVPAKNDADGDGIKNTWLVNGKPAAAPATPKATVAGGRVKLALGKAPRGTKLIRVYRKSGNGSFKAVKTVKPTAKKPFTDKSARRGKTYTYKTVAVNAKGKQSAASKPVVVEVPKSTTKRKAKKVTKPGVKPRA